MSQYEAEGSAAASGAPRHNEEKKPGLIDRLASVQLALWLVAILAVAMALATIIPQKASVEVYEHALGHFLGPLISKSALRDVYGAWWFIGAFALLALSLLACSVRRAGQLFRQHNRVSMVSRSEVEARPYWSEWRAALESEAAVAALSEGLRKGGYAVSSAQVAQNGAKGLTARRGPATAWGPVIVHIGLVIVLFGAAYGRLPAHSYRAVADLDPGGFFEVKAGEDRFAIRLLEAGSERDPEGRPTKFWARAEILENGEVVKSATVEPNRPLRHRGVVAVLQSLSSAGFVVEVRKGENKETVPVVFAPDGSVAMLETVRELEDPRWIVFIHNFRAGTEGGEEAPAAQVFVDRSGHLSHNWEQVGWVGEEGMTLEGVQFRLTPGGQSAQFLLDRDIGVPFVWVGFCIIALGTLPLVGIRRRAIVALVTAKGDASTILIGGNDSKVEGEVEKILVGLGANRTRTEREKILSRSN